MKILVAVSGQSAGAKSEEFKSESADFTLGQLKKIVPGGQFSLFNVEEYWPTGKTLKPGAKVTKPIKVIQYLYTITSVENTSTGLLKTVHAKVANSGKNSPIGPVVKLSAAKFFNLLTKEKPTKTDAKGTMCIRLASTKADSKTVTSAFDQLSKLDKQIADLQAERNAIQAKLDKQAAASAKEANKAKEMKLSEKGVYFSVEVSKPIRAGEEKVSKPSLTAARNVRPHLTSSGSIYAVVGKKKQKVMSYTSKDPVTGKAIKGKAWFFVSKEMQKKFG